MKKPTTISKASVSEYREFVQLGLRKRVLEAIEVVLEEEVDQELGCRSYERAEDRRGYRNGAETRRVTTSVGTRELRVPRARVRDEETGETTEFRSELLPRYARRTREVDESLSGTAYRQLTTSSQSSSSFSISSICSSILRAVFGKVQTADPLGVRVFGPNGAPAQTGKSRGCKSRLMKE